MSVNQTINQQISEALSSNSEYNRFRTTWQYFYQSYMGGQEYREGAYLTRYQQETREDYRARLYATPLDNHCASVIQVYNSFLFREDPERDFGSMENSPAIMAAVDSFLRDADLDGRSMEAFMKDVATWASVFGACWIIVVKPATGAITLADEQNLGVRPYLNLMTPLAVTDWEWRRSRTGVYELVYLKYVEEFTDSGQTIKIWTPDTVQTIRIDTEQKTISTNETVPNELGYIPAVIAYNLRSNVRSIGISDITDIADAQRMLYNINSEIEQSIRVDSHPSLVKTPETQAGIGAGSIIQMPDNLDPGLKPYILDYNGAELNSMLAVKQNLVGVIDKMANTGAIRASESRTMSGIAMETEFQLLNARLSAKGDNLELAEEQIWSIFAHYMGTEWNGSVEYPGSFNIRDTEKEFTYLQLARQAATDPTVLEAIDIKILEALDLTVEPYGQQVQLTGSGDAAPGGTYVTADQTTVPDTATVPAAESAASACPIATQDVAVNLKNRQKAIQVANYGPLNPGLPNRTFWMAKAHIFNTTVAEAQTARCGNCAAFNQTTAVLDCIDAGLAAGGSGTADAWNVINQADLGYCEMWDFKCAATRTCDAWVTGGPVTD
jgi:hypothetical protein